MDHFETLITTLKHFIDNNDEWISMNDLIDIFIEKYYGLINICIDLNKDFMMDMLGKRFNNFMYYEYYYCIKENFIHYINNYLDWKNENILSNKINNLSI